MHSYNSYDNPLAPVDDYPLFVRCVAATGAVMQHGCALGRLQQVLAGAMVTR